MLAPSEVEKVYNVALMAGYDHGTAIRAARIAINRGEVKALTVTGSVYHSVGDRVTAISRIGEDFALLENDMMRELGWKQDHPSVDESDPRTAWWRHNVVPILESWQKFQAANLGSWVERFTTSWDSVEAWQDRLMSLRSAAKSNGFDLSSPEPQALPTTVFQDVGNKISGAGKELWSMIKILVYAGAIIVGVVLVSRFMK